MILDCKSERDYAMADEWLPELTPIVSCMANCPKCGPVFGTILGHLPGQELPKQIEHKCGKEKRNG